MRFCAAAFASLSMYLPRPDVRLQLARAIVALCPGAEVAWPHAQRVQAGYKVLECRATVHDGETFTRFGADIHVRAWHHHRLCVIRRERVGLRYDRRFLDADNQITLCDGDGIDLDVLA